MGKNIDLTIKEQNCIFHNKTFYEYVSPEALHCLIESNVLLDKWNTANYSQQLASTYYDNEKTQLLNYSKSYNKVKNGYAVRYHKAKRQSFGRVYPHKSLGLTTFSKKTRNTLIKDSMTDIDIKNAAPQIIECVCKTNTIDCKFITEYIQNRDQILSNMMQKYNLTYNQCKNLFIRLVFGGTFYGWVEECNLDCNTKQTQFITHFIKQLADIGHNLRSYNEDLYEKCKIEKKKKDPLATNFIGSFLSKYFQEYETRIVECMFLFLSKHTNIVDDEFFVYEYDGIKLIKSRVTEHGLPKLLSELEKIVHDELGFTIKLEEKPIDIFHDISLSSEISDENAIKCFNINEFIDDNDIDKLKDGYIDCDIADYIYNNYCFYENQTVFSKNNQIIVSSGIKNKCQLWYSFKNGKWNSEKDGIIVSKIISTLFYDKVFAYFQTIQDFLQKFRKIYDENDKIHQDIMSNMTTKYNNTSKLATNARRASYINTIVSNVYDNCKINNFEEKLDLDPNLVCCNNGVIDLQNKSFRNGLPSDMCSLSTNIDYREDLNDSNVIAEIDDFFFKLFPHESQRDYVLNHIASVFYGTTANQSFNYYVGGGSNGKSLLVDLISFVMGDYKGSVPLQLITQKRPNIGGTSSEVIALRGVRYAVIQEPSKNDTINEGVMKELTGGDPITARGLYKESVTFKPMFDLAICANIFLNITSNDHGTWRRIKVVEFGSKFVDNGVCEDDFIFKKDLNLSKKFDIWKEYLLYKLIQIAFINEGKVGVFSMVQSATERYRVSQDKVGQYIDDMIIQSDEPDALVLKTSLSKSFKEWCENKYKYSIKAKDLFDRLDETYNSNYVKYKGFEIKGFKCASNTDDDNIIDKDEEFIVEFEKQYDITMDMQNDFVKRSDIQAWCKDKNLKLNTTKEITRILLEKYKIDCSNKEFCKNKKIDKIPYSVIFGLKLKIL